MSVERAVVAALRSPPGLCKSAHDSSRTVRADACPGMMMTTPPASPAHEFLARQLHVAHRRIADEWLERMAAMLSVGRNEVFPSEQLLDHIPALIDEIANFLEAPADSGIAANTAVMAKAAELGELRYDQRASVHQLLREYQVFGDVLQRFIEDEVERSNPPVGASDALSAMARLTQAVRCLEQQSIDTFVTRYTEKIEQQTAQVREFTRFVSHEIFASPWGSCKCWSGCCRRVSERRTCPGCSRRSTATSRGSRRW